MTEVVHRTTANLQAENARLRADLRYWTEQALDARAEVAHKGAELDACRRAMAAFAADCWDAYHRLGGVARMAEVSAMDTSEGADE